ncbi:MAG: flavodoxin domain-containing protein [Pseudomonadota bacterium]
MMTLIVFASLEGQTKKIARFVEQEVRRSGDAPRLADLSVGAEHISLGDADAVIAAAPVHERRHPESFEVFLASQKHALANVRTLLISVSLSAAFAEGIEEARDYVVELKMRTKFEPDMVALVAGAVRMSGYDYFQSQIVKHVVLRDHAYDPTSEEHEFTDWDALAETIARFLDA